MGVKPIKVDKINFNLVIFKKDNNKFCKNKGGPGIILNIIKNSIDELDIYLSKLFKYLSIILGNIFLIKTLEKVKKTKLPKTKEIIDKK